MYTSCRKIEEALQSTSGFSFSLDKHLPYI